MVAGNGGVFPILPTTITLAMSKSVLGNGDGLVQELGQGLARIV